VQSSFPCIEDSEDSPRFKPIESESERDSRMRIRRHGESFVCGEDAGEDARRCEKGGGGGYLLHAGRDAILNPLVIYKREI